MSSRYVALATAISIHKDDLDDPPLRAALEAAGVEARVLAWDDPAAQPQIRAAAACVIRSTWNYVHNHARFVAWADELAGFTNLFNPAPVVRWNSHKGYLLELERRGIPVVPTHLVQRGSEPPALASLTALGSDTPTLVIKPAVSAGSYGALRVGPTATDRAAGEAHLQRFLGERDMLIQRYLPSVEDYGERSLIWIDGAFTHAVRKQARFSGDQENISQAAMPIADDERALAERILPLVPWPLLYARVDLVRDQEGQPRLMELELIEPSLFFGREPAAAERMAAAIARLVNQ